MITQLLLTMGRLVKDPAVHTTAAIASMPAAAAGLHAVGLSTDLDTRTLAIGLLDSQLWLTLGMAAVFGGIGGVMAELLSLHGNIELPHRVKRGSSLKRSRLADPRYEIDLGIVSRLLLGAAAGLALLSMYAPTSPTALLVNALIAGSTATGLFRLVQGRLLGRGLPPVSRRSAPALGVDEVEHQRRPTKIDSAQALRGVRVEKLAHAANTDHLHRSLGEL
jgi:hypothetical protein